MVCDDVQGPATLDPQREFSEKNHTIVQQIYEGLVRLDPKGRVEPALAESWERVDPRTVEFRLRQGVRFHNGETFDADSVRFSVERYLDPKTGFPAQGFIATIKEVQVVDPGRVRIVTHEPDGALLNRLAGFVVMVPPRYMKEKGSESLARAPMGTGPFRFVRWEDGQRIVLERNPDYWMAGHPLVAGLIFRFLPLEAQVDALLRGEIDILTSLPGTETLRIHRNPETQVIKRISYYTIGVPLRLDRPPLDDIRVRRALNYGLDKEDLIRYDAMGNGKPVATLTLPGQFGHNPRLKPYPYEPETARRLLEQAGFGRGLRLKALVDATTERAARIMARQWERIGISLEIVRAPDAEQIERFRDPSLDLAIGDVPDPTSHAFFIQSIVIYSSSPYALARYPGYDRLLEESISTVELDEQRHRFEELDAYVHENALSVFTYQSIRVAGLRKGVRFQASITGMPHFFLSSKGGAE